MAKDIRLDVTNFRKLSALPPASYAAIRFDSNLDCNVHCVYCHNPRSDETIDLGLFREFVAEKVLSADEFQIGCQMEPTLDKRLCDFMLAVAASPAKPRRSFRLQTNGILLHRHDPGQMIEAGLTVVSVSVDSARAETQRGLRGGTSLSKVKRNILDFRRSCPAIPMRFVTTVTRDNIDEVDELVAWGVDAGVAEFAFRQMFYIRSNTIVDHDRMTRLLVTESEFANMQERLESRFGDGAKMRFMTNSSLVQHAREVSKDSLKQI